MIDLGVLLSIKAGAAGKWWRQRVMIMPGKPG